MPHEPTASPAQFIQGAPALHVKDVQATKQYYLDVLGFRSDFGDENYCVVWRDNSAIHLAKADRNPSGVHLFQWVKDADAIYEEVMEKGAHVVVELEDRPYGVRDFTIVDPNGVEIIFGQDIE